jgi:phosphatidylglycerol:prolipoprotein diacylglycerol transferase
VFPKIVDFSVFGKTVVIGSYGVMVAVGFLVGLLVSYRQARRASMSGDDMLDLFFWVLVSSVVGSRLLYVIVNWSAFSSHPWEAFAFWQGGLVFYGGLIGALISGFVVVRLKKLSYLKAADAIAPALAVGHALGRVGCFGVGCCWGKATTVAWSARFPPLSVAFGDLVALGRLSAHAHATMPLHPVQLYEAAGEVLIFLGLVAAAQKKRFAGFSILCYLIAYGSLRFVTEIFRGDPTRKYVFELSTQRLNRLLALPAESSSFISTSQAVSLILVPLAAATLAYLLLKRRRRNHPVPAAEGGDA